MCPVCFATVAMMAAGVASTGTLAAVILHARKSVVVAPSCKGAEAAVRKSS